MKALRDIARSTVKVSTAPTSEIRTAISWRLFIMQTPTEAAGRLIQAGLSIVKPCLSLSGAPDAVSLMRRPQPTAMHNAALSASALGKHSRRKGRPHGFDLFLAGRI